MEIDELEEEIAKLEDELVIAKKDYAATSYGGSIAMIAVGGGLTLISGLFFLLYVYALLIVGFSGNLSISAEFLVEFLMCIFFLGGGIPLFVIGLNKLNQKKKARREALTKIETTELRLKRLNKKED